MPPKKATGGKKEDGKGDEGAIEALQAKLMEKGLEIETLTDKINRLEKRSQHLASLNESQRAEANENEEKLRDVIACLTSGLKEKDTKSKELEILLENTKAEADQSIEVLTKELNELKSSHKFIVNDLHLQLDNAEVQLRGIDHFNKRRESIEQENVGLKAQLEKERKDHQESISDVQRTALQEKERLRKEIAARVEETKQQMLLMMDGQLNAIEEDMARRNHMYQKTMRLLVYKLREKGLANNAGKSEEEDLKWLICQSQQLKADMHGEHQEVEKPNDCIGERTEAAESASTREQVTKLLYACFEDLEMEKLGMLPANNDPRWNSDSILSDGVLTFPTSVDKLTTEQRHDFLRHVLHMAISLRAVNQNTASSYPIGTKDRTTPRVSTLCYPYRKGSSCKAVVPVEDILALPIDMLHLDEPVIQVVGNQKPVSVGVQTEQGIGGD